MISQYEKASNRQYPAKTLTDADYTDNLALLTITPAQAIGYAAGGISLYGNINKTEFMF